MNITNSILIGIIFLVSGFGAVQHMKNKSLEVDNHNQGMAIKAYEALLKVEPFEAVTRERKERTDEKIDAIVNDDTIIVDHIYSL